MLRPVKQEEVAQTIPEEEMPQNEVSVSESGCVRNGGRKGLLFDVCMCMLQWVFQKTDNAFKFLPCSTCFCQQAHASVSCV